MNFIDELAEDQMKRLEAKFPDLSDALRKILFNKIHDVLLEDHDGRGIFFHMGGTGMLKSFYVDKSPSSIGTERYHRLQKFIIVSGL